MVFVNAAPQFLGINGTLKSPLFEADKLHPNAKGSAVLLGALKPFFDNVEKYTQKQAAAMFMPKAVQMQQKRAPAAGSWRCRG